MKGRGRKYNGLKIKSFVKPAIRVAARVQSNLKQNVVHLYRPILYTSIAFAR